MVCCCVNFSQIIFNIYFFLKLFLLILIIFFFFFFFLYFFFQDLIFGLGVADWDQVRFTPVQLTKIIRAFKSMNTKSSYFVCFYVHWTQMGELNQALLDEGFNSVEFKTVYKSTQNVKSLPELSVHAVEMLVIARFGSTAKMLNMPASPLHRHNHITILAEANKKYRYPSGDLAGEVVNSTEKPPITSFVMSKNMVGPEGNVFVCGVGAGGDMIGFILAKILSGGSGRLYGIDSDPKQFDALIVRMQQLALNTGDSLTTIQHNLEKQLEHQRFARSVNNDIKMVIETKTRMDTFLLNNFSAFDQREKVRAVVEAAWSEKSTGEIECICCGKVIAGDSKTVNCDVCNVLCHSSCATVRCEKKLHTFCSSDCSDDHVCVKAPEKKKTPAKNKPVDVDIVEESDIELAPVNLDMDAQ